MRLVILGPSHHPVGEPFAGGLERFTADLARGLRRRGHHVELYGLEGSDASLADRFYPMPRLPALNGLPSTEPDKPDPQFLQDQFVYTSVLRDLLGRDDIDAVLDESLHHLPPAFASILTMPVITTLHTPPFSWMEIGVSLAGSSGNFVSVSHAMRDQWLCRTESHVILNGVDPDPLPVGAGGPDLAWVGRLTPEKGADLAIEAARRSGHRLRVAGPISNPAWFDSVVRPMLSAEVEYVGPVRGQALAELYGRSAATLITPRWEEPFCLVAAESQMCGTPVVGIRRGGLPEVVTGAGGILVAPSESLVDDLAAAVPQSITLDRRLVADRARETLHWDRMIDGYEQLLTELCADKSTKIATSVVHNLGTGLGPQTQVGVPT